MIRARGAYVRFAVTHLQHNNAEERLAQSTRIAELLGGSAEPVVLVGDLNAPPGAPELEPLASRYWDAWERGGVAGDPGFTYDAENPHARIDYVLVSPGVAVSDAHVYTSDASDHLPFAADVRLPR